MNIDIDRIVALLSDPRVLFAVAIMTGWLLFAVRSATGLISLFACFSVIVSICPPALFDGSPPPPLSYGLETLRSNNRIFSVMLGGGLLLITSTTWGRQNAFQLPFSGLAMLFLHTLIFVKNLNSGIPISESLLLFGGIFILFFLCWQISGLDTFEAGSGYVLRNYIPYATVIFFATTGLQFIGNRSAMAVIGGRFNGLTSNAQMFIICMASLLPSCAYLFFRFRTGYIRYAAILCTVAGLYWSYQTGSRLSLVIVATGLLTFFRYDLSKAAIFVAGGALGLLCISLFSPQEFTTESRVFSLEDTRTWVWKEQWETFLIFPLFGAPIRGHRLIVAENSWLGVAAGMGVIGLVPMLALAYRMLQLLLHATRAQADPKFMLENSLLVSIGATSLVASIFEPFLLGILTFPMVMFMLSMFIMERNFELSRRQVRVNNSAWIERQEV